MQRITHSQDYTHTKMVRTVWYGTYLAEIYYYVRSFTYIYKYYIYLYNYKNVFFASDALAKDSPKLLLRYEKSYIPLFNDTNVLNIPFLKKTLSYDRVIKQASDRIHVL